MRFYTCYTLALLVIAYVLIVLFQGPVDRLMASVQYDLRMLMGG